MSSATLAVTVVSNSVVIATYSTLTPSAGPFATFTGLQSGWAIDYQANGGTAIALSAPPQGKTIIFN